MVCVHNLGVLITGRSGIGKSESALELIRRGFFLVADDGITITRGSDNLSAEAPELTRNIIEVKGVGVIDVEDFRRDSVFNRKSIDFAVDLVDFDPEVHLARIEIESTEWTCLGVDVTKYSVPVLDNRETANVIEILAALISNGINPARAGKNLLKKHSSKISGQA